MAESSFGEMVRSARERLGWSKETLAHHSGLSWSAISQIESGRRADVRLSSLTALAGALGVTIDYLGGVASSPPPMCKHRVLVHETRDEYLAAVIPFLREGIERSDGLLVVADRSRADAVRDALAEDAGRIEFGERAEWHSRPADAMRRYRAFTDERLASGAHWVRIVGEPGLGDETPAAFRTWARVEALINVRLAGLPVTILCAYDKRVLPAEVLDAAERTHPERINGGGLTACSAYMEPEDLLLD